MKEQLCSQSIINQRSYGTGNSCEYIVIHETANYNDGAGAQVHANLQSNYNPRKASWQIQVDHKEAIRSFEDNIQCWHAGGDRKMNLKSIGIEICVNYDSKRYRQALHRAVKIVQYLMRKHNIPIDNVITHHDASWGKHCPAWLLDDSQGISWQEFIDLINDDKQIHQVGKTSSDGKQKDLHDSNGAYKGNSIVDYLKSIGESGSFAHREELAKQYGISNYRGTASQNLKLLNLLRSNKKSENNKTSNYQGNSIVEYLQSINEPSSFSHREKLAKRYGINNYRGTASQNLKLLDLLRGGKPKKDNKPKYPKARNEQSIVDFLKKNGESGSFAHRADLAERYGIDGYQGTASQNIALLNKLKSL